MIEFGDAGPDSGFESRDVQDIWIDGPGDKTVRPCPPELLPFLMAQREKMTRWQRPTGSGPEEPQSPGAQQNNT